MQNDQSYGTIYGIKVKGLEVPGMETMMPMLTSGLRFVLPILALIILFRCTKSLLRDKYDPEIWAYLGLPNGSRVPLYHWENVIGRAKSCDVVLGYPTLSRSHCALIRDDKGQWEAIDLESKAGVLINNKVVDGSDRVRQGDILNMGGVELVLLELNQEEITEQRRARKKPGRFIRPSGTMFFLTLFQAVLCIELCIAAGADLTATLPISFAALAGIMWAYFIIMRTLRRTGFEMESLAFFLSSVGLAVVATSAPEDLMKQIILLVMSLVVFLILCFILRDLNRAKKLRWPVAILGILLLLVGYGLGSVVFGAKNWIIIGGISIQPSELVKIAFIFAGAATLDRLFARRNLILFIGYTGACIGILALMSDFGTAVVFFAVFLVIAFLRSGDIATIALAIAAAVFAGFLILIFKPYVADRFSTWGNAWSDPYGNGMQQVLAMASAASGGFFGLGAGSGTLYRIAAADTDLVFALVSEELGLIVALCCVAAVVIPAIFVIKSSATARSSFYVIAAGAAVTIMMTQMILNVFGSLDIIPFTGVTFPFVSKGGSSLISCWGLLAFIKAADTRQNASFAIKLQKKRKRRRMDEEEAEDAYDDDDEEDGDWEEEDEDETEDEPGEDDYDFEADEFPGGLNEKYFHDDYDD